MSAVLSMKPSAAEYFASLSPVKCDSHGSSVGAGSRGGRCHCCPYGYHIDLDFVRFCHSLAKDCQHESATLRKLKLSKRQRRRETHSMEVMLGLATPQQDGMTNGSTTEPPPPPVRRNSLRHPSLVSKRISNIVSSSPSSASPHHQSAAAEPTPPQTDRGRQGEEGIRTSTEASSALQEAMLDFEEAFVSSHDTSGRHNASARRQPTSGDRHTSTGSSQPREGTGEVNKAMVASMLAQAAVNRVRSASVTRSNSLPRHFPEDSSRAAWFSRTRPSASPATSHQSSAAFTPSYGGGGGSLTLKEALASLDEAKYSGRQVSSPPPPDDLLSVTSSQLSTSTLQSIRDQVAAGLSRLRELEAEVSSIPHMKRELQTLRCERDELQGVAARAQQLGRRTGQLLADQRDSGSNLVGHRRRSPSPVRVNLQEFCSYRRARASSVSDCSDSESVTSERHGRSEKTGVSALRRDSQALNTRAEQNHVPERSNLINGFHKTNKEPYRVNGAQPLFISEGEDRPQRQQKMQGSQDDEGETGVWWGSQRGKRDASTSCRVLTRDVGIVHSVRVRSVGLTADLLPKAQSPLREKSPAKEVKRPSLVNLLTVNRSTQTTEEKKDARTRLLSELGRQDSSIIQRLSEVKKDAPALMFDNSTNTERLPVRSQGTATEVVRCRQQTTNTLLRGHEIISKEDVDAEVNERVQVRVDEIEHDLKAQYESRLEEMVNSRVQAQVRAMEEKYQLQVEREVKEKVLKDVNKAKERMEVEKQREIDLKVSTEVNKAREAWTREEQENHKPAPRPLTWDRSVQVTPPPQPKVEEKKAPDMRTVGAGDCKVTDVLCERCALPKRSVGCSWDKVTDVVCDTCHERKHALTLKPLLKSSSAQTVPEPKSAVSSIHCQTLSTSAKTVATNTVLLPLKKDERSAASPVITPELERRPFGSSSINICDKCHDTITSVAKDIVGTSSTGPMSHGSGLPVIIPLPPSGNSSKIPRLVDPFKLEPSLDGDGPSVTERESNLRHSDSRLDRLPQSKEPESPRAQLRKKSDHTLDNERRNSLPPSTENSGASKVPFNRQQTYTKFSEEDMKSNDESSTTTTRKMSALEEQQEEESKPQKSPEKKPVNIYRRERSSPEISVRESWTRGTSQLAGRNSANERSTTSSIREENFETGRRDVASRDGAREASPLSKPGRSLDSSNSGGQQTQESSPPPRKATPIPQQATPPAHFRASPSSSSTVQKAALTRASPPPSAATTSSTPATTTAAAAAAAAAAPPSIIVESQPAAGEEGELLDSGDESVVASSVADSYSVSLDGRAPRQKLKLGRSLRAALKVLNDSIGKPVRSGQQLTNALNIIQRDWFKVSSQSDSDPHLVEEYLDVFEMQYSKGLLHRVVNLADVNGNTAMHYAVSHGNFDVVSLLLDSKVCSVNQQNKAGYTATMLVSLAPIKCAPHAAVVERLFSMSDVNVRADQHGQTALMLAVSHGRLDTVRLLLAAGADVNIQDDDGSTALMCAAEHGHLAIVRFLLQCPDTDAHLVDNDGSSALAIAVEAGHKDVGVLLYKHMNLARGSSPYSSLRGGRRGPRSATHTPPARFSAPPSPGRSRRGSGPPSPPSSHHNSPYAARRKTSSASLSNLNF